MASAPVVANSASAAIDAEALTYRVAGRELLARVDLAVKRGESVAITGPSGAGKTSLLMCMAGLLPITAGRVRIAGTDLATVSAARRASLRLAHVGFVYQFGELMPELTPTENVALPLLLAGARRKAAFQRAEELLELLGAATVRDGRTETLSGGERQRVALARALATRPSVVLADEPTGSLDSESVEVVCDLMFSLPTSFDCALVVVTHNPAVAGRAGVQWELNGGTLAEVVA